MLNDWKVVSKESVLTAVQLQSVRTMLERTRSECDDNYCLDCYLVVHSGGKRLGLGLGLGLGFDEYNFSD
jgi:hypothetical protein